MAGKRSDLDTMTMAELTREAHRVGIPLVAHMSTHELIEAIEQQRETNALYPAEVTQPEPTAAVAQPETTPAPGGVREPAVPSVPVPAQERRSPPTPASAS